MEQPLSSLSATSAPESAAAPPQQPPVSQPPVSQPPRLPTNSPKYIPSPPKSGEFPPTTISTPGSTPIGLPVPQPAAALPQSTPQHQHQCQHQPAAPAPPPPPPASNGTTQASNGPSGTPSNNPRLRSSIACARCRRSKIKCTNAGAGTTCEACAHSGRECIYPAPGATDSSTGKRSHGDEGQERIKRSRAKKSDAFTDKSNIDYALRDAGPEPLRAQVAPMAAMESQSSALRGGIWLSPALKGRVWKEVFDLFQLHYGTELPFLHAPTFLPKLTEEANAFGANATHDLPHPAGSKDVLAKQLIGLGLLTLTARFHKELVNDHWTRAKDANAQQGEPSAASDYYASALRNILMAEQVTSDQQPSLEKVQALLMLTLYDWSLSRGVQAWMHLGLAIRMAQAMGLFYEDMNPAEMWAMGFANQNAILQVQTDGRSPSGLEAPESSSDMFVEEESRRRTAWSCFILDRYLSNGSFRPGSIRSNDLRVQLPCAEKAWAFGERVCTPFLTGQCSHNGETTAQKMRLLRRKRELQRGIGEPEDGELRKFRRALEDNDDSNVSCEKDESEGLLSRFVKISEIWGKVARKTHAGVASGNGSNPKVAVSAASEIEAALHSFRESSPRSFRLSDSNIRAHVAQHTSPPFTLLNAIYSICRLVLYRDSLVFLPITLDSPIELDETDHGHDSPMKRLRHAASVQKFFAAAQEFLSLFEACRSQRLLPGTPMMGFGLYLVSFAGIYAFNLPHMDSEGAVCGSDSYPRSILESQQIVLEALKAVAQMRFLLPVAQHWFRTLHRLHTYYRKAAQDYENSPQSFSRPQKAIRRSGFKTSGNATLSASHLQERSESISRLDDLFKDLGNAEDDLQRSPQTPNGVNSNAALTAPAATRGPDIWNPVNNSLGVSEPFSSQAGSPQHYPSIYQPYPNTASSSRLSPNPYDSKPPSFPPPITSSNGPSSAHPHSPPAVMYHWTMMQQPISGEDVAAFIDGRSESEWAAMKMGWELVKEDQAAALSGSQEPTLFRKDGSKPGWYGCVWGWM